MSERAGNIKLAGVTLCPGLALGQVFVYREKLEALAGSCWIDHDQVEEELRRIDRATEVVAHDLAISAQRIESNTNARLARIFESHEALLQDAGLRREIRSMIEQELICPEHALAQAFRRREQVFRQMAEPIHRQHADDVADLAHRLLRELEGIRVTPLERMPRGRVVATRRLLPSDTIAMPEREVAAIVTECGGPGSHVALLAEALGIPMVAQVHGLMATVKEHDLLVVDGVRGEVIINPDALTQARYREECGGVQARNFGLKELAQELAHTRDGVAVAVMANVSRQEDTAAAAENGADGVGLCRLEGFYMSRKTPPTSAELLAEIRTMFVPMAGKPITIRLLDSGGDKPLPFLSLAHETNPFLGQRGVRVLLRYPELLDTQLHALCTFSQEQDMRILVPMITFAEEMAQVRDRLVRAARDVGAPKLPPLGAMIETPGAALSVAEIKDQADFLSIGTNDLTQYTFAAGRANPLVSDYFREDHPALLRQIRIVVEEAGEVPVAVCGELARQIEVIPALLSLGIRILSVPAPLIPEIKAVVRQLSIAPA